MPRKKKEPAAQEAAVVVLDDDQDVAFSDPDDDPNVTLYSPDDPEPESFSAKWERIERTRFIDDPEPEPEEEPTPDPDPASSALAVVADDAVDTQLADAIDAGVIAECEFCGEYYYTEEGCPCEDDAEPQTALAEPEDKAPEPDERLSPAFDAEPETLIMLEKESAYYGGAYWRPSEKTTYPMSVWKHHLFWSEQYPDGSFDRFGLPLGSINPKIELDGEELQRRVWNTITDRIKKLTRWDIFTGEQQVTGTVKDVRITRTEFFYPEQGSDPIVSLDETPWHFPRIPAGTKTEHRVVWELDGEPQVKSFGDIYTYNGESVQAQLAAKVPKVTQEAWAKGARNIRYQHVQRTTFQGNLPPEEEIVAELAWWPPYETKPAFDDSEGMKRWFADFRHVTCPTCKHTTTRPPDKLEPYPCDWCKTGTLTPRKDDPRCHAKKARRK